MHAACFVAASLRSLSSVLLANLFIAGLWMGTASPIRAQCTPPQIRQMIRQGLSDTEIDRRCTPAPAALPSSLAGTWEITMQEQHTSVQTPMLAGPGVQYWYITVNGTELHVQRIQDAHLPEQYQRRAALPTRNVHLTDGVLSFTLLDPSASISSTTQFQINLQSVDVLEGRFVQTSAGVMGLPPHQSAGTVTLRRVDLKLQGGALGSLRYLPTNPLPRDWPDSFCMPNCD